MGEAFALMLGLTVAFCWSEPARSGQHESGGGRDEVALTSEQAQGPGAGGIG